ncbi:MAG: putative heme protein small subunit NaxS [Candidatus Scalindua rubra]|uniref:Putative heme protein small subunit NaxS n=1 Tax=Candidatus Scalindua rubra TaxID=1872076 RepID=A0A1E3XAU5_9BACT|nr:MAG: putative heme protein small subunit NaxS [Candidatus Scalindua rubra]
MKKINFLCILAILAVSCFAISFSSQADELDDLIGNPEKSYYFVFATGAIQGSFGTMETCVYCHGNGGKGTAEGRKRGVPDFSDPKWQSSVTDEEMIKFLEANDKGCTQCRGRISEGAIKKLVNIVRAFASK